MVVDVSIEIAHIYTSETFGAEQLKSIACARQIIDVFNKRDETFQVVAMVDDYSPEKPQDFDYGRFLYDVETQGIELGVMVRESQLAPWCQTTLAQIKDNKLKKTLSRYINKRGKYPCSLFIATWYLMRLGHTQNKLSIKPSKRLLNILPSRFEDAEKKAMDILKTIYPLYADYIENWYFEV